MKIYIGFDDTDTLDSDFGTGKVSRWFKKLLPRGCACQGVVRQQLLVCDDIPYTSHNSAACMLVEAGADNCSGDVVKELTELAAAHIMRQAAEGSDPGLCVASESDSSLDRLMEFGYTCTHRVSNQKEALEAVNGSFLAGLGGSNDGLIGAAAAVGLTAAGWSGRYIEYGALRRLPEILTVAELSDLGIQVISTDRDARIPSPRDRVRTNGWVRPFRLGRQPVLVVSPGDNGLWVNIHAKRKKKVEPEART